MQAPSQLCERARTWASVRADGELSELETALLDAHLRRCAPCRTYARGFETVASALRSARLERPAPLALVLPRRRGALRLLQVAAGAAVVVAAGALAALVAPGGGAPAAKPVAMVASADSPDRLRELRRPGLIRHTRPVPRNKVLPGETV